MHIAQSTLMRHHMAAGTNTLIGTTVSAKEAGKVMDKSSDERQVNDGPPLSSEERPSVDTVTRYRDHYRALLDNLPFPAWLKDTESRFLAVNEVFVRTFGATDAESMVGKTDFDIATRPMAEGYRADDRSVLASLQKKSVEEEIIDQGVCKWFETYKAPVIGDDGALLGTVGLAKDISETKEAERILKESEERFRLIFENSGDAILFTSPDGRIESANPAASRLFGYSEAQLRELGHAGIMGISDANVAPTLEQRSPMGWFCGELHYRRSDGLVFPGEVTSTQFHDSHGVLRSIVQVRDITARKLTEEKLRKYSEEVEDIYQNAPCGYHSLDKDGVFVRINDTELKWLGYPRQEVIGRRLVDFLSPATAVCFTAYFNVITKTGFTPRTEVELIRKDGTFLPVQITATVLRDEEGNFLMSRAIVIDLREQKHVEEERARQTSQLDAMSRQLVATQEEMRRRLSAELHDRTSPNLAAILINLGILADELSASPPDPGAERNRSADLVARVEDARALIEDTAASIREISTELRPPLLDYAGLLPAMESYSLVFSKRNSIAVRVTCPNAELRQDPEMESVLFRIFQEALTNCAKHSGASVAEVSLMQSTHRVALTITDNGCGFDPGILHAAPFGSGLGLINMKEMAQFAGGTLIVESQPGKGTRIHVEI